MLTFLKSLLNLLQYCFCFMFWFWPGGLRDLSSPAAAAAKSLQSCPTMCDPRDGSPPGSPVPGILQARTLEWVAMSFSNAWEWKVKVKSLGRVQLFAISWTTAYQAPPPMLGHYIALGLISFLKRKWRKRKRKKFFY